MTIGEVAGSEPEAERRHLTSVEPRPAASVMVFRSAPSVPVVLYLRRNPGLAFHGGDWVFPGGRIDPADRVAGDSHDEATAARRAAVREAGEEAGLDLAVDRLVFAVHWTTPLARPIRFSAWFFIAETTSDVVQIDGQEIYDYRWLRPADALAAQAAGTIQLAAPAFALTTRLAGYPDVRSVFSAVADWPDERLLGRLYDVPGGCVAVYEPDVACRDGGQALGRPGPRHRLWMLDSGWRYERDF